SQAGAASPGGGAVSEAVDTGESVRGALAKGSPCNPPGRGSPGPVEGGVGSARSGLGALDIPVAKGSPEAGLPPGPEPTKGNVWEVRGGACGACASGRRAAASTSAHGSGWPGASVATTTTPPAVGLST